MPRSRSRSIESRCCAVKMRSLMVCVACSRRSDSVVLPWSTCAIMQKLRVKAWSDMGRWIVADPLHKGSDVFATFWANRSSRGAHRLRNKPQNGLWLGHFDDEPRVPLVPQFDDDCVLKIVHIIKNVLA